MLERKEIVIGSWFPVSWNEVSALWFEVTIGGLQGGHPDQDIDRTRANAALLMGRILFSLSERLDFVLSELEGGTKENEIAGQASMLIGMGEEDSPLMHAMLQELQQDLSLEYKGSEDELTITVKEAGPQILPAVGPADLQKICFYLAMLPDGMQKMSGEIPGQVETSCNLGIMKLLPDGLHCSSRVSSSIESAMAALGNKVIYLTEFLGGDVELTEMKE